MEKYTRVSFVQISFDYAVLDRFNALCGYELRINGDHFNVFSKFNIYDLQLGVYVFENDLEVAELLKIWTEKAKIFFKDEYLDNIPNNLRTEEDFFRQKLYLQEIKLIENTDKE